MFFALAIAFSNAERVTITESMMPALDRGSYDEHLGVRMMSTTALFRERDVARVRPRGV